MTAPIYEVEFAGARGREIDAIAGTAGIWRWRFTCGDRAIAPGGALRLFCEVPKFWLATLVQAESPERPGFVRATASPGVRADLTAIQRFWKALAWATVSLPDGLRAGEKVCVEFGSEACPCYCVAHKYPAAPVCWQVDADGAGEFFRLWPPMIVNVAPGPAVAMTLAAPSVTRAGERFTVRGRFEDRNSNIGARMTGTVSLALEDARGARAGDTRALACADAGTFASPDWLLPGDGVYRVRASCPGLPDAWSNPIVTGTDRVAWGDGHCHSMWSDGTGSFEENLRYARDEAFLDVFGFAEHLCIGEELTTHPVDKPGGEWALLGPHLATAIRQAYAPGRFVTLLGYEYTPEREIGDIPRGDFCLFSPGDDWGAVPFAVDWEEYCALAERHGCLVIPHVGGSTPEWDAFAFRPAVTPLVEIASMHGHFECYAQGALQRGLKLGFVGMSDGHFGMPGYDNWAQHGRTPELAQRNYSVQSAITAFLTPELTRAAVFQALRDRRVYATTGQRILLDVTVNGAAMGSEVRSPGPPALRAAIHGTAPIALVDVIRGDRRVLRVEGGGRRDLALDWVDPAPLAGETWYYLRVTQEDFSLAWSSPIWVTCAAGAAAPSGLPAWDAGPDWPFDGSAPVDAAQTRRLQAILERRGLSQRFTGLRQVGLFAEPRGRFAFFRGYDAARQDRPVHLHLYTDFADDRLYIADGHADFGIGLE